MSDSFDESERVSVQISSLSTQLIESIEKQSQLEERLNQAKKTIQGQKSVVDQYEELQRKLSELEEKSKIQSEEVKKLKEELTTEKELRSNAQKTVDELNTEIEDLTASLFDEANKMVATARKEGHAIEVKNTKLVEQLQEKDSILEILNLQLKNLKKVLQNVEQESAAEAVGNTKSLSSSNEKSDSYTSLNKASTSNSSRPNEQLSGPIFSPNISSVRYDLSLYKEFLKFLAVLPHCQTLKDTSANSKLLRRLVNDEIQPILRLDNASGLGWIVRRTLMSLMMEGLVIVEPLSGLNENFQFNSPTLKNSGFKQVNVSSEKDSHLFNFPSDSPPIAVHDKCSFCSEARDDVLEHARMYLLKTQSRLDDDSLVTTNSFPLCRYCLLKIRQTCEIFAFLRSLKLGAWKLEKVTLSSAAKDDGHTSNDATRDEGSPRKEDKRSHRLSAMGSTAKKEPHIETDTDLMRAPTTNLQRAWLQLCKLRSTLHWTHIGIWSIDDSIGQKIGPLINSTNEEDDNGDGSSILAGTSTFSLNKADSEDFTIRKGDDEESTEIETFDFESATSVNKAPVPTDESGIEASRPAGKSEPEETAAGNAIASSNPIEKPANTGSNTEEAIAKPGGPSNNELEDEEALVDRMSDDKPEMKSNIVPSSKSPEAEQKEVATDPADETQTNDSASNNEEAFDDAIEDQALV